MKKILVIGAGLVAKPAVTYLLNQPGFHVTVADQLKDKASGGFVSFDAPRAHFGLGKHQAVSRVEVIWSTGEKSELKGEFKAGHKYIIERKS